MNLAAAVFDNAIVDAFTRLRLPVPPPARLGFLALRRG
jgi:hypothetical protein